MKIKKGDNIKIIKGKDKGKTGKVLRLFPAKNKALVQGINFVKKHLRRSKQDEQGGIVQREAGINISNLMLICKACNRAIRVGIDVLQDGSRVRFCKKCREVL